MNARPDQKSDVSRDQHFARARLDPLNVRGAVAADLPSPFPALRRAFRRLRRIWEGANPQCPLLHRRFSCPFRLGSAQRGRRRRVKHAAAVEEELQFHRVLRDHEEVIREEDGHQSAFLCDERECASCCFDGERTFERECLSF